MRRVSVSMLLILLVSVPLAVCAQVYKWTDAQGTVHFSDTAPPHGVKYTRVKTTALTAASGHARASDASAADDADQRNDADADDSRRTADTPANRKELCDNLDANIKLLQGDRPVISQDKDGKPQVMSKSDRSSELATEQKQYQQFCG